MRIFLSVELNFSNPRDTFLSNQEQLRHKDKFNIIKFDTRAVAWKDRACDVTEQNLLNAWNWVKGQCCNTIVVFYKLRMV